MSAEQSAALSRNSREHAERPRDRCRSTRATHPSIQASLHASRPPPAGWPPPATVTLTVHPGTLMIDGQAPERGRTPPSEELAGLMHDRLVGALRLESGAEPRRLARAAAAARAAAGRADRRRAASPGPGRRPGASHFEILEIDYAEVLRERAGGDGKEWDAIITFCLGGGGALDAHELAALLDALGDSARFGELIERLQSDEAAATHRQRSCRRRCFKLVKQMLEAIVPLAESTGQGSGAADRGRLLGATDARHAHRHHPADAQSPEREQAQIAAAVVDRMGDNTIASFVASIVAKERGASERLAQALQLLVPDIDHKERLIDLAKQEAASTPLGRQASFEELWQIGDQHAGVVFGREFRLGRIRARALGRAEAGDRRERVSDDPPERIKAWMATVADDAIKALDFQLLLDLLKVEDDPAWWSEIARHRRDRDRKRRTLAGDSEARTARVRASSARRAPGGRESAAGRGRIGGRRLAPAALPGTSPPTSARSRTTASSPSPHLSARSARA